MDPDPGAYAGKVRAKFQSMATLFDWEGDAEKEKTLGELPGELSLLFGEVCDEVVSRMAGEPYGSPGYRTGAGVPFLPPKIRICPGYFVPKATLELQRRKELCPPMYYEGLVVNSVGYWVAVGLAAGDLHHAGTMKTAAKKAEQVERMSGLLAVQQWALLKADGILCMRMDYYEEAEEVSVQEANRTMRSVVRVYRKFASSLYAKRRRFKEDAQDRADDRARAKKSAEKKMLKRKEKKKKEKSCRRDVRGGGSNSGSGDSSDKGGSDSDSA